MFSLIFFVLFSDTSWPNLSLKVLLQELPDSKQYQADERKVCTYKDDIPVD
jgi:hypothetical protein